MLENFYFCKLFNNTYVLDMQIVKKRIAMIYDLGSLTFLRIV